MKFSISFESTPSPLTQGLIYTNVFYSLASKMKLFITESPTMAAETPKTVQRRESWAEVRKTFEKAISSVSKDSNVRPQNTAKDDKKKDEL